jgi:SNF2 family DNA or RNA helicase
VIVSYDIAIKSDCLFEWANLLVLDEATAIKEMKAKRTEAIHRLVYENSIERVMLLSGTPIKNRIAEFYSLIAICNYNPKIAESRFLKRFADSVTFADYFSYRNERTILARNRYVSVVSWDGLKNEEELKSWLRPIYFSRNPKVKRITRRPVLLDSYDDEELREEFDNFESGVSRVAPQVKAKAALRKAPLTYKYVSGLIESGQIEGPAIIFTDHVASALELGKLFDFPVIHGEVALMTRQNIIGRVQDGKLPGVVGTFATMSEGYTLTRSNYIAINDYPWSPGSIEQAEYRIDRIGQTRPCHVDLIFGSEQDEYIFNKITNKKEVIDKVF